MMSQRIPQADQQQPDEELNEDDSEDSSDEDSENSDSGAEEEDEATADNIRRLRADNIELRRQLEDQDQTVQDLTRVTNELQAESARIAAEVRRLREARLKREETAQKVSKKRRKG